VVRPEVVVLVCHSSQPLTYELVQHVNELPQRKLAALAVAIQGDTLGIVAQTDPNIVNSEVEAGIK
jgi:hypothetical protein